MNMNATIVIQDKEMEQINDLLNLTGEEIYQKYGYKRDETITHTAVFPNGIEADIKLVICSSMDMNCSVQILKAHTTVNGISITTEQIT